MYIYIWIHIGYEEREREIQIYKCIHSTVWAKLVETITQIKTKLIKDFPCCFNQRAETHNVGMGQNMMHIWCEMGWLVCDYNLRAFHGALKAWNPHPWHCSTLKRIVLLCRKVALKSILVGVPGISFTRDRLLSFTFWGSSLESDSMPHPKNGYDTRLNPLKTHVVMGTSSIKGTFSIAMFGYRRVNANVWCSLQICWTINLSR